MVQVDLVADMLTRIRNAVLVKSRTVSVIRTNVNSEIVKILKREGYIDSFEEYGEVFLTEKGPVKQKIRITLKYKGEKQKPYINHLRRVSKPGLRVYVNSRHIPRVLGGIGTAVLSTSSGICTDKVARMNNVGGEVLFYIW